MNKGVTLSEESFLSLDDDSVRVGRLRIQEFHVIANEVKQSPSQCKRDCALALITAGASVGEKSLAKTKLCTTESTLVGCVRFACFKIG